jgi:glycosyltransferase involved in cell wall biosynthesis
MVEVHPSEPARVLLLGTWGPQKDLKGVLEALRVAKERGGKFSVSITGAINPHFPEYREEINRVVSTKDYSWLRLLGNLDDTEILNVVLNHDLLILPYNATGGFSGAMSVGAYCGIGIISYDLPQLRETAKELRVEPMFVARGDTNALAQEILSFCSSVRASRESRRPIPRMEYDACIRERVDQLVGMLGPPRGS